MYATVVELVEDLTSFQAANSSDDEDRSENISMQTEPSSLATGVKTPGKVPSSCALFSSS